MYLALTHVCMWREKSWKRISAYEAAKLFPYGTSAHSGLFMCELCGQYVNLINGSIQSSHFRHSASEKNKDCDDRSESYSYINYFQAEAHNLPIKLMVESAYKFSLSIGFISLPEALMRGKADYKINISGDDKFSYLFSRLNRGTITYFNVGTIPASKYVLNVVPKIDGINTYWPNVISGVEREGTLFDSTTGKKLPYDADVQVGHKYYLLTSYGVYGQKRTVEKKEICSQRVGWNNWKVYEVKATEFSEDAAKFFLDYHCRLTDEPVLMYPIWPVYKESPYVVYHNSKQIDIYFRGNAEPKLAPYGNIRKIPYSNPKMLEITSTDRQQLLSAGRTDVLKYMYFWESDLGEMGELPKISVKFLSGDNAEAGVNETLPEKNTLSFIPEVDGILEIAYKDKVVEKYELNANQIFEYDNIRYGQTIKVYYGLDCVWIASYVKKINESNVADNVLLERLKNAKGRIVPIPHNIGMISKYFADRSSVNMWLYSQVRQGAIREDAFKILKKYTQEKL